MTNPRGRKISEFIAGTAIPADAQLTYISGGTNQRISIVDFLASIGVTGTIVQAGDPLGTPVLNKAGSVNEIRNLEPGSGIKTAVSPQNGAEIEHNFIENTAGAKLVDDLTALQPNFRSLIAGPGINIAQSTGEIQISVGEIPTSNKTVIVDDITDFPPAVAGVITLADNTEYLLRNDITTVDRFVMGQNTVISDSSALLNMLTYTGTEVMFTSVNKSWVIRNLTVNCPSGTMIDYTGGGTQLLQLLEVTIGADKLGTVRDCFGVNINSTRFTVATDGFRFEGTMGILLSQTNLSTIFSGTLYDFGTSVFAGIAIQTAYATLDGSSVFVSGLAGSGNVQSGALASITNCRFFGSGTPLVNINQNDLRWEMFQNDDIDDTDKIGMASQIGNAVETVISVTGTPVKLAGSFNDEISNQFTIDATGRITYNGIKELNADISMTFSAAPVSGTTKDISFYVAKNGAIIPNSALLNTVSSNAKDNTALVWHTDLVDGDYIEAFVANDDDTVNILIDNAVMRVG